MINLYDRAVSGFSLSISTGLAFESLFAPRQAVYDPERPVPPPVDISQYNQMWINVETLFRNMVEASDAVALQNTGYKETSSVLYDEMNTIESLLSTEGRGQMTPVFYICDYAHALSSIPKGFSIRERTAPNQIAMHDLMKKTMKELLRLSSGIKNFPGAIRASGQDSALILSHYPYDLLSKRMFKKLDLLESNTGKIKKPNQWNTKYYPVPKANMTILPFNRPLLLAFGDKVLIQPWPIKLRREILDIAEKRDWTPATTMDKILLDTKLGLHPIDAAILASAKTQA